ncbi:MAG: hypothetical protein QM731_07170 [Chitinophagaceae bacterium]
MRFQIIINYDRKNIRLNVEQLLLDDRIEQYKVEARNGIIMIQSNRPLFRNRGLKHRAPARKLIEGNIH